MAKTNFTYEKRQRELEKKKKADEKARKKLEAKNSPGGEGGDAGDAPEGVDAHEIVPEGTETQDPA